MPSGYVKAKVTEKPKFDRNAYYEEYLTNLIPPNFTVKRVEDKIVIQVKND